MHRLQTFFRRVLDFVLPRPSSVRQFDVLPLHVLASQSHSTLFHKKIRCYAPLRYASPLVKSCVHASKYYAHERAIRLLGEAVAPHLADILAEQLLFGLYEKPLIIPIPLHVHRLRERGYNQAERIARVAAKHAVLASLECRTDVLTRTRDTHAQARLTRAKRLKNMMEAFTVARPECVQGADIILIDDVVTTGATMRAARKALEDAGARTVLCIAVAH